MNSHVYDALGRGISKVYDAFERKGDLESHWMHKGFHCFRQYPLIVRVWPVTQAIECDLGNGGVQHGLAQLLWNTFANWRGLIEQGVSSYEWLGLPLHAAAVRRFEGILSRAEAECRVFIERAERTGSFEEFQMWLDVAPHEMHYSDVELFYYYNEELVLKKHKLLQEHLHEILSFIKE